MIVKCNQANKIRIGNSTLKLKYKLKFMVFLVQEKFWKEFYFTFYGYLLHSKEIIQCQSVHDDLFSTEKNKKGYWAWTVHTDLSAFQE